MTAIENEAKSIATGLGDGVQEHNLAPVLDQLNKDKETMSPKDYASLIKDMNKSVQTILPGIEFEDTSATGPVSLVAQDKYGVAEQLTGDAAGAANLQAVAADAKMPNAETFVQSKLDGAKLLSTDAQGNQTYGTSDGGTIDVSTGPDGTTTYRGSGQNTNDNFVAKITAPGSKDGDSVVMNDSAYETHGNYDITYGNDLTKPTSVISEAPDGTITDKKVSYLKQDLAQIGIGAAAAGAVAADTAADYEAAKEPDIADRVTGIYAADTATAQTLKRLSNVEVPPNPPVPVPQP